MSDDTASEGGCLCGAIRYRITGPVGPAVHCHCSMCRRATGGTVVTWVTIAAERFAFTRGEAAVHRSSDHGERRFCATCGAQVAFRSDRHPDDVDVTVATLDDPEPHAPDRHIWTQSKIRWLRLDEHLPAHPRATPPEP